MDFVPFLKSFSCGCLQMRLHIVLFNGSILGALTHTHIKKEKQVDLLVCQVAFLKWNIGNKYSCIEALSGFFQKLFIAKFIAVISHWPQKRSKKLGSFQWWQLFSYCAGWCGTAISRRAGKVPHVWWSQKKAICFSSHYWTAVGYLGNEQQSLMGDRGEQEYFKIFCWLRCHMCAGKLSCSLNYRII